MVIIFRLCFEENSIKSGTLAIVPSSFIISHITPAPLNPANFAKSTAASVCPILFRTPPFFEINGNICPGLLKSSAFDSLFNKCFIVSALSNAEIPVVVSLWSIETVKAVS
ncbi:hypothetical protein D3C76_669160 [compost metagenome]